MQRRRHKLLLVVVAFFVSTGAAHAGGFQERHSELPAGSRELYRYGSGEPDRDPVAVFLTREGRVATLFHRADGKNEFVFYSRARGGSEFEVPDKFFSEFKYGNRGLAARGALMGEASQGVVWISFDEPVRELFCKEGVVDDMFVNDEGLVVVDARASVYIGARRTYYLHRPGEPTELFDDDDPRAAQSRFVGDPQGNICDVEIFEGSTSPLKQLRDKALAIEKRKPRRSAAPVNPPLVIPADGVNEHYGLVYTVNDPKLFQLFTYRKSDGETAKVFESPYDGSISSRDVQTGATVLFLADSGDMLVEITAPNLKGATKLIAGPTKTFLYRREANELIDFNPLLPAGEQFVVAWGMNHRGDVLFSSTKSYYFLPANSTKPSVVRTLSGLKFPVHGERLGEDRKIYFWAQLDNGEWVLCQIPAMATLVTPVTIGLGAAALAAAGAVFWIVRKRRLANGAASLQHPSDPAEVPIHLHR